MKSLMVLLLIPFFGLTQEVKFCEKVDKSGNAINVSEHFNISRKGGLIKMLVHCGKRVNSSEVIFDVYSLKDGKEKFENTIRMSVNPLDTWFYKELSFFKEGDFIVYVYDEKDQLLGTGKLTLVFRD
jgi:hypothetical protein